MLLGVHLALAWPACAAIESGLYQTIPGATVEERGERVPNGSRVVPFSATLTFDLGAQNPSLFLAPKRWLRDQGSNQELRINSQLECPL